MAHALREFVFRFAFTSCQLGVRRGELTHSVAVGQNRDCLLQGLQVLDREQYSRRPPMHRDHDTLMLPCDPAYQF